MTTAALETRTPSVRIGWTPALAPLAGLALVAGLIVLMLSPASDDRGSTAASVVSYAESHDGWKSRS
jgi:hypothetical protein